MLASEMGEDHISTFYEGLEDATSPCSRRFCCNCRCLSEAAVASCRHCCILSSLCFLPSPYFPLSLRYLRSASSHAVFQPSMRPDISPGKQRDDLGNYPVKW
jgi:hypothetical protein